MSRNTKVLHKAIAKQKNYNKKFFRNIEEDIEDFEMHRQKNKFNKNKHGTEPKLY